jgi:hypothetical protein
LRRGEHVHAGGGEGMPSIACDVRVMTGMRKWGLRRFPQRDP